MMKFFRYSLLFSFVFSLCPLFSGADNPNPQGKYVVYFTDKQGVDFDPYTYFDSKAIERRLLHNISLYDSTDYPVNESYINTLGQLADSLVFVSRWFNAVVVYMQSDMVPKVLSLPFVSTIESSFGRAVLASYEETHEWQADTSALHQQIERMGASFFDTYGLTGKGVRIAVFDAGFPSVDTHEAFAHLRENKRIIKTWDFVRKRENVYAHSSHGTSVLSCIAGVYEGKKLGMATDAEFLLARTEMSLREPFSEEEYWLAAAEWADKNGAHIINSSLGYTYHRYFPENMDGRSTLVSRAANMAASKGILVVNAAGNDGDNKWKYVGAPADADSVLSVGGITQGKQSPTESGCAPPHSIKIGFSSFGPTADKRMKPNVCAYGKAFVAKKKAYDYAYGTSFSSPLVAGFAACALQSNPEMTNMELFKAIEQSGDLWPYFDYAHGFGVPQARHFTSKPTQGRQAQTLTLSEKNGKLKIKVSDYTWENQDNMTACAYGNVLFYHIQNTDGTLHKYFVVRVLKQEVVSIDLGSLSKGQRVNASYLGYYGSYLVE